MNQVNKNILANYFGKIWGFVAIYVFVPFYIKILGIESYAIINFYAVIIGLLAFADAGLTATLTREMAKTVDTHKRGMLVYTFERIYLLICILIAVAIILFSKIIATNWLNSQDVPFEKVNGYIKYIGIGISLQLFSTLYQGALMGLQQQVLSNKIQILWSFFRSGLIILPLYFLPSLDVYFLWQIGANLLYLIILRVGVVKTINNTKPLQFDTTLLKSLWKYALGMMLIAFISGLNIQVDKLVTSKLFSLSEFGYYSLASTISQLPLLIATPIIAAVFPLFTDQVAQKNQNGIAVNFHRFSYIITGLAAPATVTLMLYTPELAYLWTGNEQLAMKIAPVAKVLLAGGFFLCLQLTPYYLALAHGHTKTNIALGVFSLALVFPLLNFFIKKYGLIGAAVPWAFINFIVFVILGFSIIIKYMRGHVLNWILKDILVPLIISILISLGFYLLIRNMGIYPKLIAIVIGGSTSLLVNIFVYHKLNPGLSLFNTKCSD